MFDERLEEKGRPLDRSQEKQNSTEAPCYMSGKRVSFLLTGKQSRMLDPLFELLSEETCDGMIIGQVFDDKHGGNCFVEVGFFPVDRAREIQAAAGVKVGEEGQSQHLVDTDI